MILLFIFILILSICFLLFFLSLTISCKKKNNFEKMSPFECGFLLLESPRNPFSLRFFMISIMFLIFDIEVVLIMPLMVNSFLCNSILWIFITSISLFILIWGLIHEWTLGSLEWV